MNDINCLIVDDEPVAREILQTYVAKIPNLKLIKSCKNAIEAFEVLHQQKIDLVFLDINMPEISGLSLAKSINKNTRIIFTTAHREYALEGFDLQAIDYLLKPISFERFFQAVNKSFGVFKNNVPNQGVIPKTSKNEFIFVRSERKMIKIIFDEILYIESLSDYIKIHLRDKIIVTRETITNIEKKLPTQRFLRIHRSYVVNINCIDSYTNEFVEIGKNSISISRTYKENVLTKLAENS
ncbi:response regulator transcription factor [Polaribacter aestuariivivens]|uniref:Response regulator transcription factor n=1 Tax=Polaribacter aestuariivivens TaxID=2304626 RepID=A0A5S3NAF8_9FLAO|nr:response regulator transcription factor [Polaribacter aestuariivivens]TMM32102.1 response regulator transcription factor [Polaribacter aestuariivivens]